MGATVFVVLYLAAGSPSLVPVARLGLVGIDEAMDLFALVIWRDFFLPSLQPKSCSGASAIFDVGIWLGSFRSVCGLFSEAKNS